jgi:hypothetical protein
MKLVRNTPFHLRLLQVNLGIGPLARSQLGSTPRCVEATQSVCENIVFGRGTLRRLCCWRRETRDAQI